jgi:hypothetical protein
MKDGKATPPMHKNDPASGERDYADRDIPVGKIMVSGLYITIFTILTFVGIRFLFLHLEASNQEAQQAVSAYVGQRNLPPAPQLQVDEPKTWAHQLAIEKEQTERYAWVDQKAGVVRIPVERAMELVAERGLPARAPAAKP